MFGPPQDWLEVVVGRHHSCGLRSNGELLCWGLNDQDQTQPPDNWVVNQVDKITVEVYLTRIKLIWTKMVGDLYDPDPDGDGLSTEIEEVWGLNPMNNDSGDGLSDADEFGCQQNQAGEWQCPSGKTEQ